jgi:two-component system, NarL family, response regulator DegU
MEVITDCSTTDEVIRRNNELHPDVILLDEEISGSSPGETTRNLLELQPDTKIIVIIKPFKNVKMASHFNSGTKAYIDKNISLEEMKNTIHCVVRGGMVLISRSVYGEILKHLEFAGNINNTNPGFDIKLSKRELEILKLLAKRPMSNKEIAETLYITDNTVKAHLGNILEKMKVRTRQQAVILAKESGLVESDVD